MTGIPPLHEIAADSHSGSPEQVSGMKCLVHRQFRRHFEFTERA